MPESVKDRPTKAHEQIFLLSKSAKYYYDADAISEDAKWERWGAQTDKKQYGSITGTRAKPITSDKLQSFRNKGKKNKRSVWTITPKPFKGAHFAVFPTEIPETCLLAGSLEGGVILDPFNGAGTTGIVALKHGRSYIGIELNPEYVEITKTRYESEASTKEGTLTSDILESQMPLFDASLDDLFEVS
jgi:DNA modification methylase